MNTDLTPELEQFGRAKERTCLQAAHKNKIRSQIATAVESLRAVKGVDGETFFDALDTELHAISPD